MALRASAPRQGEEIHVAQRGGFFPLTPAFTPGERVTLSRPRAQSKPVGFPLRDAPCSLSLRERVRVRGNGANYHPSYRFTHRNVMLSRSSGGGGGLQNDCMSSGENIFVHGIGAVSPAGWGVLPLREALARSEPLPVNELARPGWTRSLRVRPVPPPSPQIGRAHV